MLVRLLPVLSVLALPLVLGGCQSERCACGLVPKSAANAGVVAPASAALVPPSAGKTAVPPAEPESPAVLWRFRTGASVLAPAQLSGEGELTVGTSDGYVHRLRTDGSYRWSYTVKGAVRAPIVSGRDGVVFVATQRDRVYALRSNGTLAWVFQVPNGIASDLVLGPKEHLYFVGRDRHLYALSQRGGIVLRVAAGEPSAGPVAGDGAVWVGTRGGEVVFTTGLTTRRVAVGAGPLAALAPAAEGAFYAVSGAQLFGLTPGSPQAAPAPGPTDVSLLASAPSGLVAVSAKNELFWLDASGAVAGSLSLRETPSAPPLPHTDGRCFVPTLGGAVLVVAPDGSVERVPVASSRLLGLSWEPRGRRLIVTASEGVVAAVQPDS